MLKRYLNFIPFILIIIILFSACGTENTPSYSYTEEYRRISEPFGFGFVLQENMLQTIADGRIYEFQSSVTEEQRETFISNQEKLCQVLSDNGISTTGLNLRILSNYHNWTDSKEGLAYYSFDTMCSWKQVLTTLQVALGDYTNYGYLYALANNIAVKLNWEEDTVSKEATTERLSNNSDLLNLVYLFFDETYTNTEDIAACKILALDLLSGLENIWSEADFLQARLDYAKTNDIDYQPTYLTFAYYSQSCPLKIQTRYMEIFRDKTFCGSNEFLDGYIKEDYMTDAGSVIHTFEWLDEQLTNFRETFAVTEDVCIPVQLSAELPNGHLSVDLDYGGLFVPSGSSCTIYATTVTCLAHEYIHFLFWHCGGDKDPANEAWHTEAVAHYYNMAGEYEQRKIMAAGDGGASIDMIEVLIGQEYDEPCDEVRFVRCALRTEASQYLYFLKENYFACSAFGEYFVRTYGEDGFLACMLHPSETKQITGKTMDEILNDWVVDMQDPSSDKSVGYAPLWSFFNAK